MLSIFRLPLKLPRFTWEQQAWLFQHGVTPPFDARSLATFNEKMGRLLEHDQKLPCGSWLDELVYELEFARVEAERQVALKLIEAKQIVRSAEVAEQCRQAEEIREAREAAEIKKLTDWAAHKRAERLQAANGASRNPEPPLPPKAA